MSTSLFFGAIADDYTGAADLAGMLRKGGVRTVLLLGLPEAGLPPLDPAMEAVVVALKTRSIAPHEACRQARAAARGLLAAGVRQLQFKYCSTFDSTEEGNIGPVLEALLEETGAPMTVAVPALPVNGRTQYLGHLFVGDRPLHESHMREHPVTPMADSNLVRHLQRQMRGPVGLVRLPTVRAGSEAVRRELLRRREEGCAAVLVDAVCDDDLVSIAGAVAELPLVTGGSGLGQALPRVWRRGDPTAGREAAGELSSGEGGVLLLAGSCSAVTLGQLEALQRSGGEVLRMDVLRLLSGGSDEVERLTAALRAALAARGWAACASSAGPEARAATLEEAAGQGYDADAVRSRIESATAEIARRLVGEGAARALIVAGGETTGAAIEALRLQALTVDDELEPGVPVLHRLGDEPLSLVFKSGSFGSETFFLKALRRLGSGVGLG